MAATSLSLFIQWSQKFLVFCITENVLLAIMYILGSLIDDIPAHVKEHVQRNDHLVKKLILQVPDEVRKCDASRKDTRHVIYI